MHQWLVVNSSQRLQHRKHDVNFFYDQSNHLVLDFKPIPPLTSSSGNKETKTFFNNYVSSEYDMATFMHNEYCEKLLHKFVCENGDMNKF